MHTENSKKIFQQSKRFLVGGVNSPVRAFSSVKSQPIAIKKGKGAYLFDEDNNKYLDFSSSWGPLILGHNYPTVYKTLQKAIKRGTSFGTITKAELKLASLLVKNISFIEKVRFVNSGTEAVMTAVRLARGYTQKDIIIKFEGCYHGHSDSMLVKAGSGLVDLAKNISEATSKGIPNNVIKDTIVLPLDDEQILQEVFEKLGSSIAAVIFEACPANAGLLKQSILFIQKIQQLTKKNNVLFILDEVITGFRLSFGGFADKYKIKPDLVTYGKIIGGGLPVGAIAGEAKFLDLLAPIGPVYQAGTLSGNPLTMKAGIATLKVLLKNKVIEHLQVLSNYLNQLFIKEITPLFDKLPFAISLIHEESIFWMNIHQKNKEHPIRNIHDIDKNAPKIYARLHLLLLNKGIYLSPSIYEVFFLSYVMNTDHIEYFILSLKETLIELSNDYTIGPMME